MLNEAAGLPRLLRSLAALEPPAAEVLAVDGGSPDATDQRGRPARVIARGFPLPPAAACPLVFVRTIAHRPSSFRSTRPALSMRSNAVSVRSGKYSMASAIWAVVIAWPENDNSRKIS